jgi:alpha-L-rhamnosidase
VPGTVAIDIDKTWKFAKEKPADWEKPDARFRHWPAAKEFMVLGGPPWGSRRRWSSPFRRRRCCASVHSDKPLKRAMLYASALGLYELHLNGEKIGEDLLAPGWTDFQKRVHFMTYDVTQQVKRGDNAIAADPGRRLGTAATSAASAGAGFTAAPATARPARARIRRLDRSRRHRRIVECAYGPWREPTCSWAAATTLRREIGKWDQVGFNDSAWKRRWWMTRSRSRSNPTPATPSAPGIPARQSRSPNPYPASTSSTSARTWSAGRA